MVPGQEESEFALPLPCVLFCSCIRWLNDAHHGGEGDLVYSVTIHMLVTSRHAHTDTQESCDFPCRHLSAQLTHKNPASQHLGDYLLPYKLWFSWFQCPGIIDFVVLRDYVLIISYSESLCFYFSRESTQLDIGFNLVPVSPWRVGGCSSIFDLYGVLCICPLCMSLSGLRCELFPNLILKNYCILSSMRSIHVYATQGEETPGAQK